VANSKQRFAYFCNVMKDMTQWQQ